METSKTEQIYAHVFLSQIQGRERMMPEKDSLIMQREAGASPLQYEEEAEEIMHSCWSRGLISFTVLHDSSNLCPFKFMQVISSENAASKLLYQD